MPAIKVGVREFREKISTLLESDTPIAVTRRGETLGVYVPTRRNAPRPPIFPNLRPQQTVCRKRWRISMKERC